MSEVTLPAGELVLRLRIAPVSGGLPLVETVRFDGPASPSPIGSARLLRRGPDTALQFVRTGSAAFRRNDILRLEVPVAGPIDRVSAELLDRTGKVMPIPVATRLGSATGEITWATAEVALAPLAAGDYAVRTMVASGSATREFLTAFMVE
jgi:hypothetical protein